MSDMLELIEKAVAIPSFTDNSEAVEKCFELYKNIFFNCKIYIKEVIIGGYKSILFSNCDTTNFTVLNVCHTDVVKCEEYKMTRKDNIIYGRGVFDMKSFLIMNLLNLKEIIEKNIRIKYGVIVVSDEEKYDGASTKYWTDNLKAEIVLNNDTSNGKIDEIVKENLGAATVQLHSNNIFDEIETLRKINKSGFIGLYSELTENTVNFYFDNKKNIHEILKKCIFGSTKYKIIMLNDYIKNNINNRYFKLYKNICEKNNVKIKYIIGKNTDDSRFFSYKGTNVISHQANGGDNHKPSEWLDFSSLITLKNIQLEFLENTNNLEDDK